jgi:bacterial/archaeal transporter family-2 protein
VNGLANLLIAVVSGIAITLQGQFMGLMDKAFGTRESVFLTYGSGGLIAGVVMLIAGWSNLRQWTRVPWYAFSAGLLGLVIVGTIGYVVQRMGAGRAFTLIIASQLILAAAIDHFGLFGANARPLDLSRMIGLTAMLVSVWLVVR